MAHTDSSRSWSRSRSQSRCLPLPAIFLFYHICMSFSHVAGSTESEALLKFKASINNNKAALQNWASGSKPCNGDNANWIGILCSKGKVWGLQLENMGLKGLVDVVALMGLPDLRTVSFINNSFQGPVPDVSKLGALKSVFLSRNQFSGEIPGDAFAGMGSLKKLYLSRNHFSGRIPKSLTGLSRLLELKLDGNQFDGEIPEFNQKGLQLVNVSYNKLAGQIPAVLNNMDSSSFAGNKDLCGKPLTNQCPLLPPPPPPIFEKQATSKSSKKPSMAAVVAIIMITVVVALAIVSAIYVLFLRQQEVSKLGRGLSTNQNACYEEDRLERGSAGYASESRKDGGPGSLVFVREDRERFELLDLLRSSAEVLGAGSFGSCYKAVLSSGLAVVVKRYREMDNVRREEFEEHMRRIGRLRHPNLLPTVAFYYRREEMLLVTDFVANGSLLQQLHEKQNQERPKIDWPTRLKIIKGVARGLAYLYNEFPNLILPHGHLKSSNVLLTDSMEPLLTDYTLAPVMNQGPATKLMVAYNSPEYLQYNRTTKKSDVWSLGILILEILTGKFPSNYFRHGNGGIDLANWVKSVVSEEWTGEVFDSEMGGTMDAEREMLKLLQIGLNCCESDMEKRWQLREVIEKIEELKIRDSEEEEDYSSTANEEEICSTGVIEEELSFSINNS